MVLGEVFEHGPFVLGSIEPSDVAAALSAVESGWRIGISRVPDRILVAAADSVCRPLARIFSKSIDTGVFPTLLKDTKVIPLYSLQSPRENTL